jgi:hypothetical protein
MAGQEAAGVVGSLIVVARRSLQFVLAAAVAETFR